MCSYLKWDPWEFMYFTKYYNIFTPNFNFYYLYNTFFDLMRHPSLIFKSDTFFFNIEYRTVVINRDSLLQLNETRNIRPSFFYFNCWLEVNRFSFSTLSSTKRQRIDQQLSDEKPGLPKSRFSRRPSRIALDQLPFCTLKIVIYMRDDRKIDEFFSGEILDMQNYQVRVYITYICTEKKD